MSDSIRKKGIFKDKGPLKESYWRMIRRIWKHKVKVSISNDDVENLTLPQPKAIVNDYDYSDYSIDCRGTESKLCDWCEDSGYCKMKSK